MYVFIYIYLMYVEDVSELHVIDYTVIIFKCVLHIFKL